MDTINNEDLYNKISQTVEDYFVVYKQYLHKGLCKSGPCQETSERKKDLCCAPFIYCIHASNNLHNLPKHPNCDCFYQDLETMTLGTISEQKPSPDVWLKLFGKLPDYYITKEEAEELGWSRGKDLSRFAPGKMIGGNVYNNNKDILPVKENRI